jgi:hypothetical protein
MLATAAKAMQVLAIDCIWCLNDEKGLVLVGASVFSPVSLLLKANFGGVNK